MSTREYSRIIIKRSTELGVQPTIPVNEEFSNEWNTTDLFVGELFMNTVDDRLWTRTNNGIVEIPMSGISSENFYTDSAYILSGTTLAFDRTNATGSTLAYTVDLAPMFSAGTVNTYLTGGTLSGSTLKLTRNDGVDIEVVGFNSGSGSTFDCSDLDNCESFNNLRDRVDALQSGATDTGVILTGITEDISMLEADILTNSGKIATNEGNISGLTSNLLAVNQDIGDLTGRINQAESDIIAISGGTIGTPTDLNFAISDESTPLTVGTDKLTLYAPYGFNISNIYASLSVIDADDYVEFDIKVNDVSILSTKLTIDAGDAHSHTATVQPVISSVGINPFDKISVDITAAGSVTPSDAAGAKIYILGTRT